MKINVEKKNGDTLKDILDAILNLNEADFAKATHTIDYDSDMGLSFYYDDEKIEIPLSTVFSFFSKSISNYQENSEQREKIGKMLDSRNEDKSFSIICSEIPGINELDFLMVKKVFEILKKDELFEKFKNFDENKESFILPNALKAKSQNIKNYLKVMISIFGNIGNDGTLENSSPILDDFYIANIEEYKDKIIELFKIYEPQVQEETKKLKYSFDKDYVDDQVSILDDEPKWKLNEDIKAKILEDMPDKMTPEEKAVYIYNKMCQIFTYDEGYVYRDKEQGSKINYTAQFSKEHLEALTSDSRITCYDFSRIYKRIIDEINEPMMAVILKQGVNSGHFYIGFATEKCQATLEAINITDKDRNSS